MPRGEGPLSWNNGHLWSKLTESSVGVQMSAMNVQTEEQRLRAKGTWAELGGGLLHSNLLVK